MVAAALAVEYADELVDGTKGAALPLIRGDLHLTYGQIGLLIAVPLLVGSLLELPLGLVAGTGRRRNRLVIAGGVVFISSLAAVALVRSFWPLLLAFVAFFPASGAFVGLTQAALMDAAPARHQQRMAAWNLAGSVGAVCGPLIFAALLAAGAGWRAAYPLLAAVGAAALLGAALVGPARRLAADRRRGGDRPQGGDLGRDDQTANAGAPRAGYESGVSSPDSRVKPGIHTPGSASGAGGDGQAPGQAGNGGAGRAEGQADVPAKGQAEDEAEDQAEDGSGADEERRPSVREALAALRRGTTARWLVLLEVSDLLLDVLTGYVGVYMVDVAHVSPAEAAIAVAVRLGAGLAGDALFVPLSRVVSGPAVLRGTAVAAAGLYPAFLLVPSLPAKLAVLAVLSACTACWYPVIQAGLYTSLPGRSGVAVSLSSAASLLGAVGPLAVGFAAQQAGLGWALASLAAAPVAVLVLAPRERSRRVIR